MKKIIVLVVAIMFLLTVTGIGFADEMAGVITKNDGKNVTVKAASGKVTTYQADEKSLKLKVGTQVIVTNGKVRKKLQEGC